MPAGSVAVKERHQPRVLVETAGLSEEEWLAYRQKGIGGSDVAALLGISPWRTARDLFYDKLNIAVVEDHEDNWVALEMGHLLEPLVAKIFQHRTGYKIYQIKKMFQHPKYPWMLADVDYFVELPDGTTAILEIKTTNYNAKDNWWLDGEETIPAYYESQGRHYMAVMDVDRCFFCCLYGNNEQESIIRDMQRDLAYLNALYSGRLHLDFSAIRRHQFPILTYAVQHGKKHFLDLVSEHSELFLSLGRYALLFEDKFCEHCNLNSLTAKNLQACDTVERGSSYFDLLEDGRQYTFEEMWLLWRQDEIYVRLYAMLTPLSVDRRLLTLRQLLKYGLLSRHMEDQELEQLARCLLEQPFSEWYRGAFGHIRGLTRRTAMRLLQKYEQLQAFIPELQSEADAIFVLNNGAVIAGQKNWTQVRAAVLTMDQDWLDLKQRFSFTDEFVEQHRESVTNFLLRGGSAMVRSLYDYLQGNDKAIEALRRIVQAELMGQFYALKYFTDDLQREIRYPISEVQEAAWKRNLTLERGSFSAEEADDFYFTMRLGELPHSTCLSCWTGNQRDCLLAAFDSNKKMILIRKGEDIVARACIRLTKGAFQRPADFDFSFADLAQEQPAGKMGASDEMLILFLERIYTSGLNDEEAETAMKMAVSLVTQKAAAIGAVAVLARRYQDCYDRDQYIGSQFYVYISKSKNGQQYLDSMGGAAVTSHKEQYTGTVFLVEQAAMRTAAPQKEDKSYE